MLMRKMTQIKLDKITSQVITMPPFSTIHGVKYVWNDIRLEGIYILIVSHPNSIIDNPPIKKKILILVDENGSYDESFYKYLDTLQVNTKEVDPYMVHIFIEKDK